PGSTCLFELDKASDITSDQLRVNGTLTYGGTLVVTNLGDAPIAGDSFILFNAAGISGTFSSFNLPALDAGLVWSFNPVTGILTVTSATNTPPTISATSNQTVNEDT